MKTLITVIMTISLAGCSKAPEKADTFVRDLLKEAGVQMQKSEEISDKDAAIILDDLLPIDEWNTIYPRGGPPQGAKAILFDYGDRGKLLSLQRLPGIIGIIDDASGMRLRHKIVVGTDLAKWTCIRKESTWPQDNPFKRIYIFKRARGEEGDLRGLIFFEGAMVEISYSGLVTDKISNDIAEITWRVATRLEGVYQKTIKPVSEGALFKNNPVLTRPDLPDPDLNETHN